MISRQILSHDSSTEDTSSSSSSSTTSSSSISTPTDNFIESNFNNPCSDPFNFTMQPEQLSFVVDQPTVESESNEEETISTLLDELFIVLYDPVEIAKMSSKLQFRHYRPQLPMRERQLPKSFFIPPQNSSSRNLPENSYSASQIVVKNYPHTTTTSHSSHSNTLNHLNSSRDPMDSYHCYQSSKSELIPASHRSSVNNVPKNNNSNNNILISNHNRHISSYIEGQYDRMFASIEVTSTTLKYQKALPIAPSFESSLAPLSSTSLGSHYHHHHQSTGNSGFDIELLQPTSNSHVTCSNNSSSSSNDDQLSVIDCSIVGHQKQRRISNADSNQFHQNPSDTHSNSWINYFNTISNSNSKSIYVGTSSGSGSCGVIGLEHQSKNFTTKSISEIADIVETQSNDNLTNQTNTADYLDLDGIDHGDFAHSNLEFASAYQPPVSNHDHSHLSLPYESNSNPSPEIVSVNIYRPIGADFHPNNHHQLSSYSNRSIQQQQQHHQSNEPSTNAVTQSMSQSSTIGSTWNSCWN